MSFSLSETASPPPKKVLYNTHPQPIVSPAAVLILMNLSHRSTCKKSLSFMVAELRHMATLSGVLISRHA